MKRKRDKGSDEGSRKRPRGSKVAEIRGQADVMRGKLESATESLPGLRAEVARLDKQLSKIRERRETERKALRARHREEREGLEAKYGAMLRPVETEHSETRSKLEGLEARLSELRKGLEEAALGETVVRLAELPRDLGLHLAKFMDDDGKFDWRVVGKTAREAFFDQKVEAGSKFNVRRALSLAKKGRKFRNAHHLKLNCFRFRDKSLLPTAFPNLTSMDLDFWPRDGVFLGLHLPKVTNLALCWPDEPDILEGLASVPNLTSLTITEVAPYCSDIDLPVLANLEKLVFKEEIYAGELEEITRANHPKLKSVTLEQKTGDLDDEENQELAAELSRLLSLGLEVRTPNFVLADASEDSPTV